MFQNIILNMTNAIPAEKNDLAARIALQTLTRRTVDYADEVQRLLDAALEVMRTTNNFDVVSDEFVDGLHHQKEEHLLFPALEAAGLSPTSGPTAVLRDEHERSKFWRARLGQALRSRDRTRLSAAASGWLDATRAHVQKENQILFPLTRRLLSAAELDRLHREFRLLAADQRVHAWIKRPYGRVVGT